MPNCLKWPSSWAVATAVLFLGASPAKPTEMKATDYSTTIQALERQVREEMTAWGISGLALALVDEQETVYATGFGEARRDSVFRCGSISKLFNATAVMQLVEGGRLELDAPVERYGAGMLPVNPFTSEVPVTLRQLLCHRSGMIREAPVGGYFDDTEPGLARTVASIKQAVLVSPPNAKTRYSNVGPSIAGHVVELAARTGFERYQREHVLGPLGMTNSAWSSKELARGRLIKSYLRVADSRGGFIRKRAPVFDLGTVPAGNLYTTVDDLACFVAMLAGDGRVAGGRVLKAGTLARMFTPQLTAEASGFGLGFMVGSFRKHKSISHSGAVYGHSSLLVFLPDTRIGVVLLANEDIIALRLQKLANLALSLMLEAKHKEKAPPDPAPIVLSAEALALFCGDYESQSYWARVQVSKGKLVADISGQLTQLTPVEPLRFLADSRVNDALPVVFERNPEGQIVGFTMGLQRFSRVAAGTSSIPPEWRPYLGSYGPGFIPLVVSERHGHLYAMTENMADYRLTPINRHVFAFPPGLYVDEHLVFQVNRQGKPQSVNLANMVLRRR
jgi:CubicO group peptidase (beta-lactamase class C family)